MRIFALLIFRSYFNNLLPDKNGVTFTEKKDMDIDSFKKAVDGVDDWFVQELKKKGYNDGQDLVDLFTK